ncbi:MAG: GDSL-type esterase/lipase family protein [Bacteroidota bacterium]
MKLRMLTLSSFLIVTLFSCDQITSESNLLDTPDEEIIPITQVADTLQGQQGLSIEFHITDYFNSEAPIVSAEFYGDQLEVTELPSDSFRVSHTNNAAGQFTLNATIKNNTDYTLESELIYHIDSADESVPITQVADTLRSQEGQSVEFHITDYFNSEAPIVSAEFYGDQLEVTELPSDSFRVSHTNNAAGQFTLNATIKNNTDYTLESELIYHIDSADESVPITQVADTLRSQEGQSVEFHITDYFSSEAPIVSAEFSGDQLEVTELPDNSFRISHKNNAAGQFTLNAIIKNNTDYTLESELIYHIEPKEDTPPPSDETLVIMPLGDSMTNDSRPRVKLWNLLENDGHTLDYVGNQRQGSSIPDPDHEGVGGIKIQGIMDKAQSLMQTHHPKYVTLMVGTNDIAWYFDESGQEIADRWNQLIDMIFEYSEDGTYILAATIPPVSSKDVGASDMPIQDRAELVQEYNQALRTHIENRRANGDLIILADMEAALNPNQHLSGDGVHLNENGYAIMGTVYYEAMNKALK